MPELHRHLGPRVAMAVESVLWLAAPAEAGGRALPDRPAGIPTVPALQRGLYDDALSAIQAAVKTTEESDGASET